MKLRRLCAFAFVPTLFLTSINLHAEQLGQYGNTWNIQEQDAIDMIKGRLGEMEKRGSSRNTGMTTATRSWPGWKIQNPCQALNR